MNPLYFIALTVTLATHSNALSQSSISGVPTNRVLLRPNDPNSLYGLAVSSTYWYDENDNNDNNDDEDDDQNRQPKPITRHRGNFLATQVWPAARVACLALEQFLMSLDESATRNDLTMCEFGCGPGLPSLMAAKSGMGHVIATDVDGMALQLVQAAAREQGLEIETQILDLTDDSLVLPQADLYLFSDVFESNAVARGAANVTKQILSMQQQRNRDMRVWVFCQSDRVQRDMYLRELQQHIITPLKWQDSDELSLDQSLWFCNVDESLVSYL